jgi:peptidase E
VTVADGGRLVTLGGGGFSMEPGNPRLDAFVLSLARRRPGNGPLRVLFVPTASGDAADYQLKFMKAFAALGAVPSVLELFRFDKEADLAAVIAAADVIYVGGGNTPAMLAVWALYGLPAAFRTALHEGAVLAGISAGANCWFEWMVTDSVPGGGLLPALGFVPGAFCPHFDSEAWRRPFVEAAAADGRAPAGFACDDSAACVFDAEGRFVEAVASVAGKQGWRWGEADGLAPLPTRLLR